MPDSPHIELIARGVLVNAGHLLACRNLEKGYYYLPGGHIEFGEAPAAAVCRELLEECGMRALARECLLVCESRFTQHSKPRHEVNIVFHVEPATGITLSPTTPIQSLEADLGFEWLDLAQLVEIDLRPEIIRAWLLSSDQLPTRPGIDWLSHP